ncbi:hypothetical protein [Anatilimnocola floriformis]|uniref:hypothetical protein n=1 Tax=Anatilimnocola floriformis TaxID=2948575 RepID=UPI0020C37768|nr:hypothetical protein [Anatilimnocola floriformis]
MRGSSTDIARGSISLRLCPATIFFATLVLLHATQRATAQDSPASATSTSNNKSSERKPERNLISRMAWVRMEIVGGRIAMLGHRCGQSRIVQVGEPNELPYEQLSVQLQTETLLLHYEDNQTERQIKLDLDDQQRITLTRTGSSPSADLKFSQPFRGPITLTIGRDSPQTYTAATLWHLSLAQPQLCEETLFPLLETLRPHWQLKELSNGILQELRSQAGRDVLTERAQWRDWVAQLNSDDFQERQLADRRLRAAGQGVVAWLQRLDRKSLTPEQAARIQDICQGLADLSTDSPQRVAAWMVDDRCAWLALLRHDNLDVRVDATNHLSVLFGKPLAFNPIGDLSDREIQLVQLQKRFGK